MRGTEGSGWPLAAGALGALAPFRKAGAHENAAPAAKASPAPSPSATGPLA